MRSFSRWLVLGLTLLLAIGFVGLSDALGQRGRGGGGGRVGGGGGRPSIGMVGGGGARPSMPMSRPATPSMSNQNLSRPNLSRPNVSGPTFGNGHMGAGNARPSGDDRPTFGNANRPTTLPGTIGKPENGISRPGPDINRPTTLPGVVSRPSLGGNRPVPLPGQLNRPTISGNRPGGNINLPGVGNNINRPNIGNVVNNGSIIVNRPSIGGNRPGSVGNVNVGNKINIGNQIVDRPTNRANWDIDQGFSRPSWGINGNDWHNNWHNNCINNHHNWYNGCWHGYWGSSWYAPVAWGSVGWGITSYTSGWGYSNNYYNPYYAVPAVAQSMPYDYSQPVIVNNYIATGSDSINSDATNTTNRLAEQNALNAFDDGLAKFKSGSYRDALAHFDIALKQLPNDAVVHETRCLALFALTNYDEAAAGLNSLLSSAPGMDWTTMSSLYGDINDYSVQLRTLELYSESKPKDPSCHFVLAYHYLVTGSKDSAIKALAVVVQNQPKDVTAKRMLDAMAAVKIADTPAPPTPSSPTEMEPETDLVGTWSAQAGDAQIELVITEDSQFHWSAGSKAKTPVVLNGTLVASAEGIELQTAGQGTVAGAVRSKGADGWNFLIFGSPPSDTGVSFSRVKK